MSVLEGCRVLLVEDESLVAMLAEDMLLDLGCEVVVAMRLDKALAYARTVMFDLAVLDVNLGATSSYPVADLLSTRGIPFLFATGYGTAGLEADYRGVPVMQKPYQRGQMAELLCHLLTCTTIPDKPAAAGALPCLCLTGLKPVGPAQFRAD
ncbi:response regulator [Methylobacterium sp. BTF04]|uniref:response regulator n=1 Tax=Methylobacterium sp. BTF04 TaxID=2708300 RepID=UPI0013D81E08|nr:response regulator [Methylobacterium sp. BTF04]NEU13873.1 response regulator [Methylobacterium sp. BTF04]